MIRYIAFFDRAADRYCSDLIPTDDNDAMVYRLAKRFTFNKYCSFVKPNEIECRTLAVWDSEKSGLMCYKKPVNVFTLEQVDELYRKLALSKHIEHVEGVTVPKVETNVNHGDFIRSVEEKKQSEEEINESE